MYKLRCKQVYSTRRKPYYVMLINNHRLCMGATPLGSYLDYKALSYLSVDKTSK